MGKIWRSWPRPTDTVLVLSIRLQGFVRQWVNKLSAVPLPRRGHRFQTFFRLPFDLNCLFYDVLGDYPPPTIRESRWHLGTWLSVLRTVHWRVSRMKRVRVEQYLGKKRKILHFILSQQLNISFLWLSIVPTERVGEPQQWRTFQRREIFWWKFEPFPNHRIQESAQKWRRFSCWLN